MLRENLNKAYLVRSKVFVLKNKAWALVAINLIPTLGRQKQAGLNEFQGQPGLQSKFLDRFCCY